MTAPSHLYELRSPESPDQWGRYHAIRRRVLFEARGYAYDAEHPDERRPGNHPKLLIYAGDPVGVVRIDLAPPGAILRRVAVREDVQRKGHGRALLALAEQFARNQGCTELRSSVDPGAVAFYEKCGFTIIGTGALPVHATQMAKPISIATLRDGAA
jgi:GNAT superfamily N-acetyltransferase